ncbi:hypothetical protein Kpol_1031p74 [Vanderwaltozyma polyspora DSM 70294]|uniref:Uncharacterized protein n=1 Tax=Vanderwaltozyma polyspora (strain ATCC 22028 / DSM 70294 / BCRC 21397 / CBS 2163 / NBRC 10782 / NRRL Y-8283 / UCD 57-17) TaxID=436907 RepID=A7TI04_VANPO|nr:uncharacterized protein Kpol_1031p74 [Vanderwaltozyma polyspora DSM 70294]EDO18166.1 hypothetical protein Kpol_1031p74 [Vanderwaltozyma polyspora DSM 70294]
MKVISKPHHSEQYRTMLDFLIKTFIRNVQTKYFRLFREDEPMVSQLIDLEKITFFIITLLKRVRGTRLQFKKACCVMIKFLESCHKSNLNYMVYLKYDIRKLIIASLVLSITNTHEDFVKKISTREAIHELYSKATGLPTEEVTNCTSIVRSVVLRQNRLQEESINKMKRYLRHTADIRDNETNNNNNLDIIVDQQHTLLPHDFTNPLNISSIDSPNIMNNIVRSIGENDIAQYSDILEGQYFNEIKNSNEDTYTMQCEIDKFNEMGKQLIHTNFSVV